MNDTLILGDRAYSSWSLRAWLLFSRFGLPARTRFVGFLDASVAEQLADQSPARTVPTLLTGEGAVIWDSLAIAEGLADRHPDAGLWPGDPLARATARSLAAEMHSGFAALREACPMNLRRAYADVPVPDAVAADLRRIETIWAHARAVCGGAGPWLCGGYSVADAFYAPVAARIAGYGLAVSDAAAAYVAAHLADPAFRRWRAMALVEGPDLPWYAQDHAAAPWPGPAPEDAAAADGPSVNDACPYSGQPVSHYLRYRGRVWGFCNAFCRDKTAADPAAWPAFQAMVAAAR
ncbi:glutathione S-transferase [Rhodobacteraceae bacterium CCMM004]|nr:glutathione S-transferase [Rhodobacteraceae bacterium CCMM004]